MKDRRIIYLFLSNLIVLSIGNGLVPLLPLRGLELGATATAAGWVLSLAYIGIMLGTLLAGRLTAADARESSGRHTKGRALYLLASAGMVAGFLLAANVTTFTLFALAMTGTWLCGGALLVLINIYTGLFAAPAHRGRAFALMGLAAPLGALIGGLALGRLVDMHGYPTMFYAAAIATLLQLPLGYLVLHSSATTVLVAPSMARTSQNRLPASIWLLLLATLLTACTMSLGRLGSSLLMEKAAFSAAVITGVVALGGLATLPFIPLVGTLSDRGVGSGRFGRRWFLTLSYLFILGTMLLLSQAVHLWQFAVVAIGLSLAATVAGALSSAMAADLMPAVALPHALSLLNNMNWLAAIVGFATGGFLLDTVSPQHLYLGTALLPLIALILLSRMEEHPAPQWVQSQSPPLLGAGD